MTLTQRLERRHEIKSRGRPRGTKLNTTPIEKGAGKQTHTMMKTYVLELSWPPEPTDV